MIDATKPLPTFVPAEVLARRLGVPRAWLDREARAGRLPCLRIGNPRRPRLLFRVADVEAVLALRQGLSHAKGEAAGCEAPAASESHPGFEGR